MNNIYRITHTIKYIVGAAVAGGTGLLLYKNNGDVTSLGFFRFGRAAIVASFIVSDYKRSLHGLDANSTEYRQVKSKVHRRSAEKLRALCCVNGGTFIKVGQHLGALEYLLPIEYVETMRVLHSEAPESPIKDMRRVIEEDFGKPVEEVFIELAEHPIGAASLAQVHRAKLADGRMVAVKIQHPRVKAHSAIDIASMEFLVNIVERIFPEFQLGWLAEETKRNLPLELDFVHEAHNCERVDRMLSHFDFLKVPKIYWEFTTPRVLTMEFCEGGQVNDKQYMDRHHIPVNQVSKKLGVLYSTMIFEQGYVHCDPHPGNVLVNKVNGQTQIVLLDHGLYQSLTDDFRLNYCKLWQSILQRNVNGIKKYSERLGVGRLYPLFACIITARSWKAVSQGVDRQEFTQDEDEEIKSSVAKYLPEIVDILNSVPRQMLLIFKTNDLLRGIESTLQTRADASSFLTMSRSCLRSVYAHKRCNCLAWMPLIKLRIKENLDMFMLSLYEWYLTFQCAWHAFNIRKTETLSTDTRENQRKVFAAALNS